MAFFDQPIFGRKKPTSEQSHSPFAQIDNDGVACIRPGYAHGRSRSAAVGMDFWQKAEQDLSDRAIVYGKHLAARHGYCRAVPFLVIGKAIFDGEHRDFLRGQMDLVAFHEWNLIWCAKDERTRNACGLPAYPGETVPALTDTIVKHVVCWKQRHAFIWEGADCSEHLTTATHDLRIEIIATVEAMKPAIVTEWRRIPGSLPAMVG